MKDWIIKLLGGHTESEWWEMNLELSKEREVLYNQTLRVGDMVYVADDTNFDPFQPYYIIDEYNMGTLCHIHVNKETKVGSLSDLTWGCFKKNLRKNPPPVCPCCKK